MTIVFQGFVFLIKFQRMEFGAEIGVLKGDYANLISLQSISKLFLIDPWISIPDIPHRWHAVSQEEMDSYRLEVHDKFSNNDLVEILEEYSFDAVNNFEDNFFDWIYLDANHSYNHVIQDLQACGRN